MSDLSKPQEGTEAQVPDTQEQVAEPSYTPTELLALEQGWRPQDQLEEGKTFIPADEFLRRGELFEKIKSLKQELHETKRDISALAEHHQKVKETEFKRAVEYLKSQKKEALVEGDADKVIEIDEQLAELRENQKTIIPKKDEVNPAVVAMQQQFVSWVENNSWYNQNEELHDYADSVGLRIRRENPTLTYQQILVETSKRVKSRFPDYFPGETKKVVPPSPDGNNSVAKGKVEANQKGKLRESDLSEEEQRVMNVLIKKIPGFTKEKYLSELQIAKGA